MLGGPGRRLPRRLNGGPTSRLFSFLRGRGPLVSRQAASPSACRRGSLDRATRATAAISTSTIHRRHKTTTKIKLEDLPQGGLPLAPLETDLVDENEAAILDGGPDSIRSAPVQYPLVVQQARNNMDKFENCVLLTRVGGFYELYFEQAEEYGPLLGLKVATKRTSAGPVPMAGFPFFQLDRFLKMLVQDLDRSVALSEEFPNEKGTNARTGGLLFDRRVARVITPGTLIDEKFMDPFVNHYLLAIHVDAANQLEDNKDVEKAESSSTLGLAWLDLSTGEFLTQSCTLASLPAAITRISPREILLDRRLQDAELKGVSDALRGEGHMVTYHNCPSPAWQVADWTPMLEREVPQKVQEAFSDQELGAASSLLSYVETRLPGSNLKLQAPRIWQGSENLMMDKATMKALELKTTLRDGFSKGSLFHAIKRTSTKGGARLLGEWLSSPSTSIPMINGRLDLVSDFMERTELKEEIAMLLKRTFDAQRLVQKFSLGRGDADDLIALARTIEASDSIFEILRAEESSGLSSAVRLSEQINLDGPKKLAQRINDALDEEGLMQKHRISESEAASVMAMAEQVISAESEDSAKLAKPRSSKADVAKDRDSFDDDVWVMKVSATPVLRELHDSLERLREEKAELAETLKKKLKASSLTLRWTSGMGHICHIKGKDLKSSMETLRDARSVGSSRTTRSFHLPEWTSLGNRIDQIKVRIRAEERRGFESLRDEVIQNLFKLRRNSAVLDELDVLSSFATLASEQRLTRPVLNIGVVHHIVGGRHAVVEAGLQEQGRSFIPNDCIVGDRERIWLITGPNMAGKSTFLRQNAVISILAQIGCFVPAEFAEIGVVDKIFSRVGSADNLSKDQSTFMVEMLETAVILREATPKSFVIMDEIGRGTTPADGTAVAFACLDHLYTVNRCRTLFATHFHELADMTSEYPSIARYCSDILESADGSFSFVHRLRKGVNRQSHALKVARLAGLPERTIEVANEVLRRKQEEDAGRLTSNEQQEHQYQSGSAS